MCTNPTTTGTDTQTNPFETFAKGVATLCAIMNRSAVHTPEEYALLACRQLVMAYAQGEENCGEVNWSDVDAAHDLALTAVELFDAGGRGGRGGNARLKPTGEAAGPFYFLPLLKMMRNQSTPPAHKRFRVILKEELTYTLDILARDQNEAREIALETEMKGEPECLHFDADFILPVADGEYFDPINACFRCKAVMEDFDQYPHCQACREQILAERH